MKLSRMIAIIGERSSIPKRGTIWRSGPRMGSVMSCRNATTGLRGSGANHDERERRMMAPISM